MGHGLDADDHLRPCFAPRSVAAPGRALTLSHESVIEASGRKVLSAMPDLGLAYPGLGYPHIPTRAAPERLPELESSLATLHKGGACGTEATKALQKRGVRSRAKPLRATGPMEARAPASCSATLRTARN